MLLEGKNAVVYGAAGSIGGAVARAFAGEGAMVSLAGRTEATLDAVATDIRGAGGQAETAVVDALDARAVDEHADRLAAETGGIDISFNAISHPSTHGTPLHEMTRITPDFRRTMWRAAARMVRNVEVTATLTSPKKSSSCGALVD